MALAEDLKHEIENLQSLLLRKELAVGVNRVARQSVATGFGLADRISFAADETSPLMKHPTIAEYERLLRSQTYTALLQDNAMLQLVVTVRAGQLVHHRYVFIPCPVRSPDPPLDVLDEVLGDRDEIRSRLILEGILRVDFDLDRGTIGHPVSHLTFSRESCRIPIQRPLRPGEFVSLVLTQFYGPRGCDVADLIHYQRPRWPRTITANERTGWHLHRDDGP